MLQNPMPAIVTKNAARTCSKAPPTIARVPIHTKPNIIKMVPIKYAFAMRSFVKSNFKSPLCGYIEIHL